MFRQQIRTKFYYKQAKTRREKPDISQLDELLQSDVLGGTPASRGPQEVEVFMDLFYKGEVKEEVDKRLKQKNLPKGKTIGALCQELRVAFDSSPPDVQEAVRMEVSARKEARKAKSSTSPKVLTEESLSPADLQRCVGIYP